MSIWGPLPLDNDDAAGWFTEFEEEPTIAALNEAFDDVLSEDAEDYVEVTEGAVAIAAAFVVVELFDGDASPHLLDAEQRDSLFEQAAHLAAGARLSLVKRALRSVEVVASSPKRSELCNLVREDPAIGRKWSEQATHLSRELARIRDGLSAARGPDQSQ